MIKRYTLDNGIRVITDNIEEFKSVTYGIWFDTGSVREDNHNNGISHYLEHMLFKGTKTRSALEIAQEIEEVGGQTNAFTGKEFTAYYAKVLSEDLDVAVNVISDITINSVFPTEELKREGEVICEEIKMYEDSPQDVAIELFSDMMFEGHPLGRPVIGTAEIIRSLKQKDLIDYYHKYYTADNMVISVSGGFDEKALKKLLDDNLGHLKTKTHLAEIKAAKPKHHNTVKHKDIEQAHLCLGVNAINVFDEDRFALSLLDTMMGGGMTSYLFQEIREKRGLVYTVSSFNSLYRNAGQFAVYAGTSSKNIPEVVKLVMEGFSLAKSGKHFTQKQLDSAKAQVKSSLLMGLESTQRRMTQNARNELYFEGKMGIDKILDKINAVTLKDITKMANQILLSDNLSYTIVMPQKEKMDTDKLKLEC